MQNSFLKPSKKRKEIKVYFSNDYITKDEKKSSSNTGGRTQIEDHFLYTITSWNRKRGLFTTCSSNVEGMIKGHKSTGSLQFYSFPLRKTFNESLRSIGEA